MGKKKVNNEEEIKDMVLPVANDVLGVATRLLGFDRVLVKCQDGHERLCRIRGKMKPFSLRPFIAPNNVTTFVRLEVPWRNEDNIPYSYPNSPLRENGYLSIQ